MGCLFRNTDTGAGGSVVSVSALRGRDNWGGGVCDCCLEKKALFCCCPMEAGVYLAGAIHVAFPEV